ncbi:hypothetical protein XMM379_003124 [Aliiroseovarius sp. xm-m-379]|uniref:hypothetical protein n=1 Tax=unclassified Aliiroseovarius TaxID=2623558 RepID=UPI001568F500|nr:MULTISPECIES: hypothetical protein [unclassified Aliiroseovarius]NRP11466.1 hypothetical protein [Aliiroseovarius sp. xm-d-517]NRP26408.1 hypothetical protein [Aliiroseovarius sp. xm-m-379]NRP32123.1 hypothetical protein [Aliiroseovarius sp. xm-m-314]NRP35206.1 hypothetical protein [Aliiroseovarius sp. xm-a-104]NRP42840.1 hypothetical protein [Aliiroseovarius sp. xm-m-339-2]
MRRIGPTRPAVAEAMVRFEEAEAARFFDTPHLVEFAGVRGEVVVSVEEESASGQPVRMNTKLRFELMYIVSYPLTFGH